MGCPAVVEYKVTFSDGSVKWPKLPGSANVKVVAENYAKEHGLTVVSIQ